MNQYRIAVCDDNTAELNKLCSMISRILDDNNMDYHIDRFLSGESVVRAIDTEKKEFDILFLDIIMDEFNGVMAAKRIREEDDSISIVFITNSPDFVFEGYDVQALHYILKPVDTKKLSQILLYDWNRRYGKNYMDIKDGQSLHRIMFDDICYLESRGRKVAITAKDGDYETYGILSQFIDLLPSDQFISCHKSFVINLNYVSSITKASFSTKFNQTVPISKARYSASKKAFINFIGKTNSFSILP